MILTLVASPVLLSLNSGNLGGDDTHVDVSCSSKLQNFNLFFYSIADRIKPIALPSRSDDELDLENDVVTATGWGYIYDSMSPFL